VITQPPCLAVAHVIFVQLEQQALRLRAFDQVPHVTCRVDPLQMLFSKKQSVYR